MGGTRVADLGSWIDLGVAWLRGLLSLDEQGEVVHGVAAVAEAVPGRPGCVRPARSMARARPPSSRAKPVRASRLATTESDRYDGAKMDKQIDDAISVSAMILRGNPDWLISMGARFADAPGEYNIAAPELDDIPTDKSLVETEIMLTAWLAGRGFAPLSPWRTCTYTGAGHRATDVRAEFVR